MLGMFHDQATLDATKVFVWYPLQMLIQGFEWTTEPGASLPQRRAMAYACTPVRNGTSDVAASVLYQGVRSLRAVGVKATDIKGMVHDHCNTEWATTRKLQQYLGITAKGCCLNFILQRWVVDSTKQATLQKFLLTKSVTFTQSATLKVQLHLPPG